MTRRLARFSVLALATAVAGTPVYLGFTGSATAEAAYASVVSAQNLHVTITNPAGSLPIVPQVDFGLGTAQAELDNNGGSTAYASSPDPGFVGTLPALAGSIVPVPLPGGFPRIDDPVIATVNNGQPPVTTGTTAYQLHAEAGDNSALATAVVGATTDSTTGAALQTARGSVVHDADGTVTALATSDTSALTILGVITLGQVHGEAKVIRDPGGGIARSSSLAIGKITVAGLTVAYENGKLTAAGTDVPVKATLLNGLLHTASQGLVTLTETDAHNTPNGVVASALNINQTVPAPPGGCLNLPLDLPILGGVKYCGVTHIVYTIGGATANTSYQAFPSVTGDGGSTGGTVTGPTTGAPLPDTGGTTTGSSALPPLSSSTTGGVTPPDLPPSGGSTGAGSPPQVAEPVPAVRLAADSSRHRAAVDLYLALVAAGLLALGATTAVRVLGVRDRWAA